MNRADVHPLTQVGTVVDGLGIPASLLTGVRAALLHMLYGIRSDAALLDHLAYNVRFQAFVGAEAEHWDVPAYVDARDRALAGPCALGLVVTALKEAGAWTRAPFTPVDALLEGWLAEGGMRFEDLARLDDAAMQHLLRRVHARDLAMALGGDASPAVRARVEANLSRRMQAMLAEDIEIHGHLRPRDREDLRRAIVMQARKLVWRARLAERHAVR